jgi:hypothetical protein
MAVALAIGATVPATMPSTASATTITVPAVANLFLPNVFVSIVGASSDGAVINMSKSNNAAAVVVDTDVGANGSVLDATAIGLMNPVPRTKTFALAVAAKNDAAGMVAVAKAGGQLRFAAAGQVGKFVLDIDPFLTTRGDAVSKMDFQLTFAGSTIFSAEAVLDHTNLAPSGDFSLGDFAITSGLQTTANLTHTLFEIPITITDAQVGTNLDFQFTQTFEADSSNGGLARAQAVPEPSTLLMTLSAAGLLGCGWLRRRRVGTDGSRLLGSCRPRVR